MPLHDLVSPWAAALDAPDSAHAQAAFRARHADLLEALRQQRAPHDHELALASDQASTHRHGARVADAEWQQRFRDCAMAAREHGADVPVELSLFAGDDSGDPAEALPGAEPTVALFVERGDDVALLVAFATAVAALTRWCAPDTESQVWHRGASRWDRWERSRDVSLAEWVYVEGVGLHLAEALAGPIEPHRLLGISRGAFHRLRERERPLRTLLVTDLPEAGLGLVLRWLAAGAPLSARTVGDQVVPPQAGRYLGWRMTAERVTRVGIGAALRMPATEMVP